MAHDQLVSPLNLVLVGRIGNGKSATGNSIVGENAFKTIRSSSRVTRTSQLHSCLRRNGQRLNVVDTPGLSDSSDEAEYITKEEIMKCMNMVRDGYHAILLVFSVRSRFSKEEEATICNLQEFFGTKIVDYMVVIFSGGDELGEDTLEEYLGRESPVALKDILAMCNNRCVLFDNKTESEAKKVEQVEKLVRMVNEVVKLNGGQSYTQTLLAATNFDAQVQEIERKFDKQLAQERELTLKAGQARLEEMQKQSQIQARFLNENVSIVRRGGTQQTEDEFQPPGRSNVSATFSLRTNGCKIL